MHYLLSHLVCLWTGSQVWPISWRWWALGTILTSSSTRSLIYPTNDTILMPLWLSKMMASSSMPPNNDIFWDSITESYLFIRDKVPMFTDILKFERFCYFSWYYHMVDSATFLKAEETTSRKINGHLQKLTIFGTR